MWHTESGAGGPAYAFFRHERCEYFPCHETDSPEDFNCLFCYCPLYPLGARCGGAVRYTQEGVKDCSACRLPHERDRYDFVVRALGAVARLAARPLDPPDCCPDAAPDDGPSSLSSPGPLLRREETGR
jgi:Zn-finger protein